MKKTLPILLLLSLLLLALAIPALAQEDAEPIEYGDQIDATQSKNTGDYWVFEGSEGDVIEVLMLADNFDAYLELSDENNDLLVENDNGGGGTDARILYELLDDGTYYILATSLDEDGAGSDYTLMLSLLDFGLVVYDQEVEGQVSDDIGELWALQGEEGDVVTISLNSDIIDTYIELYDDSGNLLAFNDDSGGTLDSQITNFPLPYTGIYIVLARSFAGGSSGPYTLLVEAVSSEAGAELVGEAQGSMEYGEQVGGSITTRDGDLWTFEGAEGDMVLIAMNSPSTDCYLDFFGPDGEFLLRDDDSGIGFNASIIYLLPTDGEYTIVTRGYNGQTGSYQLSVTTVDGVSEIVYAQVSSSDYVNLRDGAGQDADVVDSTYPGDWFVLIGHSADGQWLQIASVVETPLWISTRVADIVDYGTSTDLDDLPVTD